MCSVGIPDLHKSTLAALRFCAAPCLPTLGGGGSRMVNHSFRAGPRIGRPWICNQCHPNQLKKLRPGLLLWLGIAVCQAKLPPPGDPWSHVTTNQASVGYVSYRPKFQPTLRFLFFFVGPGTPSCMFSKLTYKRSYSSRYIRSQEVACENCTC